MNEKIKESFIIGDEWLFYKLYCGYKTSDIVLVKAVKCAVEEFLRLGLIDRWFFIRYSDPELHIRVRFHIVDKNMVGELINDFYKLIADFVDDGIISKVVIDTYDRELKRYGYNSIGHSEYLFFCDSRMVISCLEFLSEHSGNSENIRWKFGLRAIDRLLSDFGMGLDEKLDTIVKFRDNFNTEFGVEKYLKKQLNDNYRDARKDIEDVMKENSGYEFTPVFNSLLDHKSNMTANLIKELLNKESPNCLKIDKIGYIASLSHMMLNRLFRSNQRAQEMVIYNYLWKYYDSVMARKKTNKIETKALAHNIPG